MTVHTIRLHKPQASVLRCSALRLKNSQLHGTNEFKLGPLLVVLPWGQTERLIETMPGLHNGSMATFLETGRSVQQTLFMGWPNYAKFHYSEAST